MPNFYGQRNLLKVMCGDNICSYVKNWQHLEVSSGAMRVQITPLNSKCIAIEILKLGRWGKISVGCAKSENLLKKKERREKLKHKQERKNF
jgi:hypothetical protein